MNSLRDRYLEVCDDLIRKVGTKSVNHVVPKEASLKVCVGYLKNHVMHERNHFRFDRYQAMLAHCSEQHGSLGTSTNQKHTIVHVDLGTGPGIFHWVMHDHIQQNCTPKNRPQLMLFGYDQSPNMLKLAKRIWKEFDLEDQAIYFSDAKQLVKAAREISNDAHLIVTFGHVLIQANDILSRAEITKLARLCEKLSKSKRTTDIIAVDAYAYARKAQFAQATSRLIRELGNCPDTGGWRQVDIDSSVLPEGSRTIIRNWDEP